MRITHVTLRYPPASGGVEDYVQNLVERLRAAGDDVTVETTKLRTHHPATFLDGPLNDPPYVHRHPVRAFRPLAYPFPTGLFSKLKAENSELIHAHGFWYAPADIAARVASRRKIPFVFNPYYAPRTKLLWKAYRGLVGRRTAKTANAVVTISLWEEAMLRADGLRPRRVELIPPGIETREFAVRRDDPFAARGLAGKRVLFFAGRIAKAKGIDLLFRAFPAVLRTAGDVHLAIAGEDFGERAELQRLAEQLGIPRAITWLGKLPREELLAAYAHAEVFVFPSRAEAFGIAALEAQAAGCPVVATRTTSLPTAVSDDCTGFLFRPEDHADLARNVLRLLNDRDLARRFGAAGRERAHRDFTWDRSVRALRALYADLRNDSPRAS